MKGQLRTKGGKSVKYALKKPINIGPPAPSGIKLIPEGFVQRKTYEKEEKLTSDKWDLVDSPSWLHSEAKALTSSAYRDVSNAIQSVINKAFSHTRTGTISILAIGIALADLKRQVRILTSHKDERQWGERRDKVAILRSYNISEHIFDNNHEKRVDLVNFLKGRITYKESLIRRIAEEFSIEIPLKTDFSFLDEKGSFAAKVNHFIEQNNNAK